MNQYVGEGNAIATEKNIFLGTDPTSADVHRTFDSHYTPGTSRPTRPPFWSLRTHDARKLELSEETVAMLTNLDGGLDLIEQMFFQSKNEVGLWENVGPVTPFALAFVTPWINVVNSRTIAAEIRAHSAYGLNQIAVFFSNDPLLGRVASKTYAVPGGVPVVMDYALDSEPDAGNTATWKSDSVFPWAFVRFAAQSAQGTIGVTTSVTGQSFIFSGTEL